MAVSSIDEFRIFAEPFARQAVQDGRNVIYIRFAQHEPVLTDTSGIQVCTFNPTSDLKLSLWRSTKDHTGGAGCILHFRLPLRASVCLYTDLMMGNFFRVTCPYLFDLDTVAYFPLLRGRHSYDAVARIRDTTQLLLDVYSGEKYIYLHPLKVWNRYSPKMFLPHCYRKTENTFTTVEDGVGMSRFYQTLQKSSIQAQDQTFDSYDRFFQPQGTNTPAEHSAMRPRIRSSPV